VLTMPNLALAEYEFVRTGRLSGRSTVQTAVCPLSARHLSVRTARDFAQQTLRHWGAEKLLDDLGLVVAELVTNALRHGLRLDAGDVVQERGSAAFGRHSTWPLQLSLLRDDSRLLCAVKDPSCEVPVLVEPDRASGSGRGLHLVEALSLAWGSTGLVRDGKPAGKAVWALFSLVETELATHVPHVAV
jgi:Histidine kinase-like ATPase domain